MALIDRVLELWNWVKKYIKNKYMLFGFILGALATVILMIHLLKSMGLSFQDYSEFMAWRSDRIEQREEIVCQLEEFNIKIDLCENSSCDRQQELWSILEQDLTNSHYQMALGIVNRNNDLIRAFLEFGKAYTSLVRVNAHSEEAHGNLAEMYESLVYIIINDQFSIHKAYNKLFSVMHNIYHIPEQIRKDFQIEVLRYLSYCASKLGKIKEQLKYTYEAENIMNQMSTPPTGTCYRRQFCWIHLSKLVFRVNEGDYQKAKSIFTTMRTRLNNNRFLKVKLIQHRGLIGELHKDVWEYFINILPGFEIMQPNME